MHELLKNAHPIVFEHNVELLMLVHYVTRFDPFAPYVVELKLLQEPI